MKTDERKQALLHHYRQPFHRTTEPFPANYTIGKGTNPACGDDVEIGLELDAQGNLINAQFRARGCSICIASSSMLMRILSKMRSQALPKQALQTLKDTLETWLTESTLELPNELPEVLLPLSLVKSMPARKKCVMLIWHALENAMPMSID